MRDMMARAWGELRYEPTEKRVRAVIGGATIADSTRAILVWEPRRVVPSYAFPAKEVRAELLPAPPATDARIPAHGILHPGIPFGVHSSEGQALSVRASGQTREGAAFRPADQNLSGYLVFDFRAFDAWYEEDEQILAHPREPYHRVDIRKSSRRVRIELEGEVLAESTRPSLLFETGLPVRFYLPPQDFRLELHASTRRTYCPYKGEASYWSFDVRGQRRLDIAWSYQEPLQDASAITGLIAFFDEKVNVILDGQRRERPATAVSAAIVEEAGV
jgi:uncharacterized protein (DUF427 family)